MAVPGALKRELQAGDTIAGYRLEEQVGEGGMGLVFRAVREDDGREVALKVLKLELADDLIFQHRFNQEARAAAEVKDPHLVPILEADVSDGRHYLAVDFVHGGSLADRLAASGPMSGDDAVRAIEEVAAGLSALHEAGIVHRDIKPQNILFGDDGTALLTDFGLAKGRAYTVLTKPGQVIGTLDYLAPELIRGSPASPASDVYALGCVAFECLAGGAPFSDRSLLEVGMAHLEEEPPDPVASRSDVPPALGQAVLAALGKETESRPEAVAYAEGLRAALGEGSQG